MSEHADEAQHKEYHYFFDAKRFDSEKQHLTGAEIKQRGGAPEEYQLYEEMEGDHPDQAISNETTVDLKGRVKHFYAVPPATFGAE